jgi:hypothetical protein
LNGPAGAAGRLSDRPSAAPAPGRTRRPRPGTPGEPAFTSGRAGGRWERCGALAPGSARSPPAPPGLTAFDREQASLVPRLRACVFKGVHACAAERVRGSRVCISARRRRAASVGAPDDGDAVFPPRHTAVDQRRDGLGVHLVLLRGSGGRCGGQAKVGGAGGQRCSCAWSYPPRRFNPKAVPAAGAAGRIRPKRRPDAHLLQHARREAVRRVGRQHRHHALREDGARVVLDVHKVHRRAREPGKGQGGNGARVGRVGVMRRHRPQAPDGNGGGRPSRALQGL